MDWFRGQVQHVLEGGRLGGKADPWDEVFVPIIGS
jgi:hypothetical protein